MEITKLPGGPHNTVCIVRLGENLNIRRWCWGHSCSMCWGLIHVLLAATDPFTAGMNQILNSEMQVISSGSRKWILLYIFRCKGAFLYLPTWASSRNSSLSSKEWQENLCSNTCPMIQGTCLLALDQNWALQNPVLATSWCHPVWYGSLSCSLSHQCMWGNKL